MGSHRDRLAEREHHGHSDSRRIQFLEEWCTEMDARLDQMDKLMKDLDLALIRLKEEIGKIKQVMLRKMPWEEAS